MLPRRPLRRVTAQINCACASAAGLCPRSRQSNFKAKLLWKNSLYFFSARGFFLACCLLFFSQAQIHLQLPGKSHAKASPSYTRLPVAFQQHMPCAYAAFRPSCPSLEQHRAILAFLSHRACASGGRTPSKPYPLPLFENALGRK